MSATMEETIVLHPLQLNERQDSTAPMVHMTLTLDVLDSMTAAMKNGEIREDGTFQGLCVDLGKHQLNIPSSNKPHELLQNGEQHDHIVFHRSADEETEKLSDVAYGKGKILESYTVKKEFNSEAFAKSAAQARSISEKLKQERESRSIQILDKPLTHLERRGAKLQPIKIPHKASSALLNAKGTKPRSVLPSAFQNPSRSLPERQPPSQPIRRPHISAASPIASTSGSEPADGKATPQAKSPGNDAIEKTTARVSKLSEKITPSPPVPHIPLPTDILSTTSTTKTKSAGRNYILPKPNPPKKEKESVKEKKERMANDKKEKERKEEELRQRKSDMMEKQKTMSEVEIKLMENDKRAKEKRERERKIGKELEGEGGTKEKEKRKGKEKQEDMEKVKEKQEDMKKGHIKKIDPRVSKIMPPAADFSKLPSARAKSTQKIGTSQRETSSAAYDQEDHSRKKRTVEDAGLSEHSPKKVKISHEPGEILEESPQQIKVKDVEPKSTEVNKKKRAREISLEEEGELTPSKVEQLRHERPKVSRQSSTSGSTSGSTPLYKSLEKARPLPASRKRPGSAGFNSDAIAIDTDSDFKRYKKIYDGQYQRWDEQSKQIFTWLIRLKITLEDMDEESKTNEADGFGAISCELDKTTDLLCRLLPDNLKPEKGERSSLLLKNDPSTLKHVVSELLQDLEVRKMLNLRTALFRYCEERRESVKRMALEIATKFSL